MFIVSTINFVILTHLYLWIFAYICKSHSDAYYWYYCILLPYWYKAHISNMNIISKYIILILVIYKYFSLSVS